MKKRLLSLALALILVFGLAACGGKESHAGTQPNGTGNAVPPATSPAPESGNEPTVPALGAGAESLKDLLEISLDYLHLEAEYHPENAEPGRNGSIYSYYVDTFIKDHSSYSIDLLYYVKDERYYLVAFNTAVGGVGG